MLLWIGIDVDDSLREIREKALIVDHDLKFNYSCFSLPLHVSLKISFEIQEKDYEDIVSDISGYYRRITPFFIETIGMESVHNLIWIRMKKNPDLDKIHADFDGMMSHKYGIEPNAFDRDFIFHTTLFMDDDPDKINAAYAKIKGFSLPLKTLANRFIIGKSESGKLGTFQIFKEIERPFEII